MIGVAIAVRHVEGESRERGGLTGLVYCGLNPLGTVTVRSRR